MNLSKVSPLTWVGAATALASLFMDEKRRPAMYKAGHALIGAGNALSAGKDSGGGQKTDTGTTGKPMPSNPPGQLPRPGVTDDSIKEAGKSTHTGPPKGANAELARKRLAIKAKPDPPGTPPTNNAMKVNQAGVKITNEQAFRHPTTPDGWSDKFPKDWKPKPTPRLAIDKEIESYLYA